MDQGIKNLDVVEAVQMVGADPDYSIKDLFEAIATGNFVSCSLGYEGCVAITVVTLSLCLSVCVSLFDLEKVPSSGLKLTSVHSR